MKRFRFINIAALALLMSACSNTDDDFAQQPQPAEQEGIPFVAKVTYDAGATRALTEESSQITATWKTGEQMAIIYKIGDTWHKTCATVTAVAGSAATISATLDAGVTEGTAVTIKYPYSSVVDEAPYIYLTDGGNITKQDGTLKFISDYLDWRSNHDYSHKIKISGGVATVANDDGKIVLGRDGGIVKLTIQKIDGTPLAATKLTAIGTEVGSTVEYHLAGTQNLSTPKSEFYLFFPANDFKDFRFEATVGSDTYVFDKDLLTINGGSYYKSTVKLWKNVDFGKRAPGDYTASNGDALTGKLGADYKITIDPGASVCLRGLTHEGTSSAGISCTGDATIYLAPGKTNEVSSSTYAGINCGSGVVTFEGTGTLNATGGGTGPGYPGISSSAGEIYIAGGTINASAAKTAGSIGSISAIGTAPESSDCSKITFGNDIKSVSMTNPGVNNWRYFFHATSVYFGTTDFSTHLGEIPVDGRTNGNIYTTGFKYSRSGSTLTITK